MLLKSRKLGYYALTILLGLVITACHSIDGKTKSVEAKATVASTTQAKIALAANGKHRSAKNIARNTFRHPVKTLSFFGVTDSMTVIEISPGGLWYGEILAPLLKENGQYVAAAYDATVPDQPAYRYRQVTAMVERFASDSDNFGGAKVGRFSPPSSMHLGEANSADAVLTFRNSHGWARAGISEQVYQSFYDVLKPGGVLGVVQHRGDTATLATGQFSGYLTEQAVIAFANSAGFELVARSEINANPKDTADHKAGVWSLPPVLRLKEEDKEKYLAIGESDRMTLKFRKPE